MRWTPPIRWSKEWGVYVQNLTSPVSFRAPGRSEESPGDRPHHQLPQGSLGAGRRRRQAVQNHLRPCRRRNREHGLFHSLITMKLLAKKRDIKVFLYLSITASFFILSPIYLCFLNVSDVDCGQDQWRLWQKPAVIQINWVKLADKTMSPHGLFTVAFDWSSTSDGVFIRQKSWEMTDKYQPSVEKSCLHTWDSFADVLSGVFVLHRLRYQGWRPTRCLETCSRKLSTKWHWCPFTPTWRGNTRQRTERQVSSAKTGQLNPQFWSFKS